MACLGCPYQANLGTPIPATLTTHHTHRARHLELPPDSPATSPDLKRAETETEVAQTVGNSNGAPSSARQTNATSLVEWFTNKLYGSQLWNQLSSEAYRREFAKRWPCRKAK